MSRCVISRPCAGVRVSPDRILHQHGCKRLDATIMLGARVGTLNRIMGWASQLYQGQRPVLSIVSGVRKSLSIASGVGIGTFYRVTCQYQYSR